MPTGENLRKNVDNYRFILPLKNKDKIQNEDLL